jgi:hypothetical protein
MNTIKQFATRVMALFLACAIVLITFSSELSADVVITNTLEPSQSVTLTDEESQSRSARELAAEEAGCTLSNDGLGTFIGCSEEDASSVASIVESSSGEDEDFYGGETIALGLFDYAVNSGSCMSCTFLSFFMIALADFSFLVFQYFYDSFLVIAPLTIAIWLGWRAAKLMVMGGEDGKDFLFGVVGKVALFAVVWIIATGANSYNKYLWEWTGPQYLNYGFGLANEIRENALGADGSSSATQIATGNSSFFCSNVSIADSLPDSVSTSGDSSFKYTFIDNAVKSGCFTERTHVIGIAAGAAIAIDSQHQNGGGSGWRIAKVFLWFAGLIMQILIGLIVAVTFAISAIWLIFLSLDVVVRGMITAAFSPFLIITYLYKPMRNIAVQALRGMVGALCTAMAIAIINIMAYVLVTNTPQVFTMTVSSVVDRLDTYEADEVPDDDDECGGNSGGLSVSDDRVSAAYNFLCFVGEGDDTKVRIPMGLSTPWFWYLVFTGVAIFALGRKIIKMIEDIIGYQGASEMANSALKAVRMAAPVAGAAVAGGMAANLLTAKATGKGLSFTGGAAKRTGQAVNSASTSALKFMGNKMSHGHILAASNIANSVSGGAQNE